MTSSVQRPLLFLDVDGPLIPFGATSRQLPGGYPTYRAGPGVRGIEANPLLGRLDPALGPRLVALGCELVWATTWMDDANECVGPRIGLPQLPVVLWPEPEEGRDGLHWKTRGLIRWAAGRPFVWVDDEITDADRAWVAAHHPEPAMLHRVDPAVGLTGADFDAVGSWLRAALRMLPDATYRRSIEESDEDGAGEGSSGLDPEVVIGCGSHYEDSADVSADRRE